MKIPADVKTDPPVNVIVPRSPLTPMEFPPVVTAVTLIALIVPFRAPRSGEVMEVTEVPDRLIVPPFAKAA